ncbi:RING-H2 finger protein ATL52-like, partial [Trifolium pratense]
MAHDGDDPFYVRVIVLLIAIASGALTVVSMYHVIAIWFCHQGRTTTNQNSPQRGAASLDESTSISVADLIPTHKYHKRNKVDVVSDDEDGTCVVCLGDFEEGEELRTMPECLHSFHVPCIDMWLHSHSSCPICRASAAPSPAMNIEHQHMIDMRHMAPIAIM